MIPPDHMYGMAEDMLDIRDAYAVLKGGSISLRHFDDPKGHATKRTSKLGIAIAPAPPIRARMRVT